MINKKVLNAQEALIGIKDNMTLMLGGFQLIERAPGVSIETIKKATEGKLIIIGDIPEIKIN